MVKIKFIDNKWVELPKYSKEGYYIDGYLWKKIQNILKIQKKNFDVPFQIDGEERSGKSTLGLFLGMVISKANGFEFTLDNIAADTQDAVKKVESLPEGSVLVFDEGSLSFSSKDAMNREQKLIFKLLNVVGQKRMVFIIISPSFFDLARYISVKRSKFLIHVYTDNQLNRGRFAYWGKKKLNMLYSIGKKNYGSYAQPYSNFVGKFTDYKPPFLKEYLALKRKSLQEALGDKYEPKVSNEEYRKIVKECLSRNLNMDNPLVSTKLSIVFGLPTRTIQAYSREIRLKNANATRKL